MYRHKDKNRGNQGTNLNEQTKTRNDKSILKKKHLPTTPRSIPRHGRIHLSAKQLILLQLRTMNALVTSQVGIVGESFATDAAHVRPLSGMDSLMALQMRALVEGLPTRRADEPPLIGMDSLVVPQIRHVRKTLAANATTVRSFPGMDTSMALQVGALVEGLVAELAHESAPFRVNTRMQTEVGGLCERLSTRRTHKGKTLDHVVGEKLQGTDVADLSSWEVTTVYHCRKTRTAGLGRNAVEHQRCF